MFNVQYFLEFEQPLSEIENKIEELRNTKSGSAIHILNEINFLKKQSEKLTIDIYSKLTPWQIALIANHPKRPYILDYINNIFTDFHELHGDRMYFDDQAIIGGLAKFDGFACMIIGHKKGRNPEERFLHNFGNPRPEGYRKILRLMKLAEKFNIPIFTFVDNIPYINSKIDENKIEKSEFIGQNLCLISRLKVPIISTIIGESGSVSSLVLSIGNRVLMLKYSIYSLISSEIFDSKFWNNLDKKSDEALPITANKLKELGLITFVVNEPIGGAHRYPNSMYKILYNTLDETLRFLKNMTPEQLVNQRMNLLLSYGYFKNL
ncbi:Acetyl-coenzyme A carboxylase carboxyl transferase subunit alpha [Candidatus Kinetoplastibacterium sorsogonicusi]|uniref:Acetyl-coenzyme A carboxylase carboxyl transferase subunit alpha n=1 Tax=Candidatus Kinetoplastidibacterium kentomonadis TaxID=1576550 RepID=A0A3Q8F3B1_9PROT|nr:acetyl-CoA carboxylase carboxyl transferase subunit alpha [Candidatus Kinetoplastibacterium sorsogonicusi]AWD32298.1 Acetyl-coenzyme A carboxylase carboxyl transferase subunit alpha [Candidatus Kinetoplastibacterium sorsogonicusi]